MFRDIGGEVKLWAHQREALTFLIDHFRGSQDPCLIRMPTGTGKTGVIACASLLSAKGRTLVLTPWSNLRDQLIEALKRGFWSNIGLTPPCGIVAAIKPSTAAATIKNKDVKVVVCTFSTLTELRRTKRAFYDKELASFFDIVIVDECHYEPAVEWGRAVKGIKKPTILLTATPYRNDLKLFRIRDGKRGVFHYTHENAEAQKIIRGLDAKPLSGQITIAALTSEFAATWKAALNGKTLISPTPRAIICCATAVEIRETVALLQKAGIDAVGIHETFEGSRSKDLVKDVPPLSHHAAVWVHQNKLTEGLDDHRFCCVAFFSQVNNDRKLIQQIGRVLRTHRTDQEGGLALLLSPPEFKLSERWSAYREFEKEFEDLTSERYRTYIEQLLRTQPSVEYFEGRFRKRFQTTSLSSDPQVAIAPSVLVRKVQSDFIFDDYIEDCTDSLNLSDAVILGEPDAPCQRRADFALWVYASISNSRLLVDTSLYEVRLEAHCAVHAGDYLLVSDTTGTYPEELLEATTSHLGASGLSRLVSESYRLTNVSVSCAVPFDTVLRSSELRAHDLGAIPTSLTDRIHICKSVRGTAATGRRYLGLHRGRVRQELPERLRRQFSAPDFQQWAQAIAATLDTVNSGNSVLQRYMQTASPPIAPIPVSMSVDLTHPKIQISDHQDQTLIALSSSVALRPNGNPGTTRMFDCQFEFQVAGQSKAKYTFAASIEYQLAKGRFWLKSKGSAGVKVEEIDNAQGKRSLADYLNQNQDLLLIGLEGGSLVYQGRNFYEIDYKYAEQMLLQRISTPAIGPCSTEKGSKSEIASAKRPGNKATAFIPGSLFKEIAEAKLPLSFSPEIVICEDLGSECADFVLANFSEKQMALVHAKAGDGKGISASAFHDIVAQAMKNLVYLTRKAEKPKGVASWKSTSRWNKTDIPRLYKAPRGCPQGAALWKKLRAEIIDHPDGRLHVILATTGCCDTSALSEAVHDEAKRTAETAQLFHLLDGLTAYARQLGVNVTVFDVPFRKAVKKVVAAKAAAKSPRRGVR